MSRVAHLLTDTVTYATRSSFDSSGDPAFASQLTATARVEHGTFLVVADNGEERRADHRVVTETNIPATARLWLPGDDTTSGNASRQIIARKEASTPHGGLTLRELYL